MNYNHALCVWRPAALALIYSLAMEHLVQQRHYPAAVLDLKCAIGSCTRHALHFADVSRRPGMSLTSSSAACHWTRTAASSQS